MEQQEHDIITRMNDKYMKMSKGHKAVAAYISDHYEQAVFMTAARLGRQWESASPLWYGLPLLSATEVILSFKRHWRNG